MTRALVLWSLLCVASGCSERSSSHEPAPADSAPPVKGAATAALFDAEGLLAGPDAPDRHRCEDDGDCVITSIPSNRPLAAPPRLAGCCPTSSHDPVSRPFSRWMAEFRVDHCPVDRSGCPPLAAPAMPDPCVHEPRCVQGRCENACGAPASSEPAPGAP